MRRTDRYKHAFKETLNLSAMAAGAALSVALLNPIPLLAVFALEVAYLVFVPDSRWYLDRLDKRFDSEVRRRLQQRKNDVWESLSPDRQRNYERLTTMREQIEVEAQNQGETYLKILRDLDALLEVYLASASEENRRIAFLKSELQDLPGTGSRVAPPTGRRDRPHDDDITKMIQALEDRCETVIADLKTEIENPQNARVVQALHQRLQVQEEQKKQIRAIGEAIVVLRHDLLLINDTFHLTLTQVHTYSPEALLAKVETVVENTTSTLRAVKEVETLLQSVNSG